MKNSYKDAKNYIISTPGIWGFRKGGSLISAYQSLAITSSPSGFEKLSTAAVHGDTMDNKLVCISLIKHNCKRIIIKNNDSNATSE